MQEQGPWIAVIFAILRASESTLSTIWNTQSVSKDHLRQTLDMLGETLDRSCVEGILKMCSDIPKTHQRSTKSLWGFSKAILTGSQGSIDDV
jgi:hypothetical protein